MNANNERKFNLHDLSRWYKLKLICAYHEASTGASSAITRNMYNIQVISLNNKLAIRIRKPVTKDGWEEKY